MPPSPGFHTDPGLQTYEFWEGCLNTQCGELIKIWRKCIKTCTHRNELSKTSGFKSTPGKTRHKHRRLWCLNGQLHLSLRVLGMVGMRSLALPDPPQKV